MKTVHVLICLLLIASPALAADTANVLEIDLKEKPWPVSPILYGLMTEEINYSYDGGLYAELIRNRTFQDDEKNGASPRRGQEAPTPGETSHWKMQAKPGAEGAIRVVDTHALTDKLPKSLEVEIKNAAPDRRLRVVNDGYWGIPIKPKTAYRASFYVKGHPPKWNPKLNQNDAPGFSGVLEVSLENADGSAVFAKAPTPVIGDHWQLVELTLETGAEVKPTTDGRFVISVGNTGTVWLSLVSLFPPTYKNRANGLRVDLMEKLAAMKPKFLRFPGGNYLQGHRFWERFDWKATLGPLPFRSGHPGCWGYRSSDGMGLMEFMGWCEDLGMEPVLGVFAGFTLDKQFIEPGPLLAPHVQDALDEIEFLTGDAKTTHWGALRAKYGHPEPYKLNYVEIGNEDFFDKSGSYDGRYAQFHDAIKAKYPNIQLIASFRSVKSRAPDLIDDHYYRPAERFYKDLGHYDHKHNQEEAPGGKKYPKVFVGEWATVEGALTSKKDDAAPTPNFGCALGDAAWMTSLERNSDTVLMQCYAPLFVNVNPGGKQWSTNLIGYNNLESYGSPSYYAWVMFANNLGDVTPPSALKADKDVFLPHSVTRQTGTGKLFLKVVNPGADARTVSIEIKGAAKIGGEGKSTTLRASALTDTNSIKEPTKIVPVTEPLKNIAPAFKYAFPALSVTVLELNAQ